jgi:hypothetical protein
MWDFKFSRRRVWCSALRLTRRHFPTTLIPVRSSTRLFQGLSCIHFTSSVDIPLYIYFHHPPSAIGPFPTYRLPPPLTTSSLDTYITWSFCRSAYSSLMMEAVRTSETSVDNHSTRQYNTEDSSEHHNRRRENLKSHTVFWMLQQVVRIVSTGL